MPLNVSVRVFPEKSDRGTKTFLKCERHHPMGWGPGLNKKGQGESELGPGFTLSLSRSSRL